MPLDCPPGFPTACRYPPANVSSFWEWAVYGNRVTGDLFGVTISLMIFVISFVVLSSRYPPKQTIATSGFITTAMSVFLAMMGLVGREYILLYILITSTATVLMYREKKPA